MKLLQQNVKSFRTISLFTVFASKICLKAQFGCFMDIPNTFALRVPTQIKCIVF